MILASSNTASQKYLRNVLKQIRKDIIYSAKKSIDKAANKTRQEMVKEAKLKFNVKNAWTGAKPPTGFRARNAVVGGTQSKDLLLVGIPANAMVAGAYTGKDATWTVRQEKGGSSQSNVTPIYKKTGKKVDKSAAGNPNLKPIGVREVFGISSKQKSRGGLKKAYQKYGKGRSKSKIVREIETSKGTLFTLFDYKKANKARKRGEKAKGVWSPIFFKRNAKYGVKRRTNYRKIHSRWSDAVPMMFKTNLAIAIHRSGKKKGFVRIN